MNHLGRTFLLLAIPAALALASTATVAAADAAAVFHWVDDSDNGTADLLYGDEPVLRYMYAFDTSTKTRQDETKKVFHHVFGPGTGTVITNGAGGRYPHHRGLFVGWNKTMVDGERLDFWHCTDGVHQRHDKFLTEGDANSGRMSAKIHWNNADGRLIISELREVTVSKSPNESGDGYGWQIDWQSTLATTSPDPIVLDGDRQHAGFQFRAAQAVAESDAARYIRPKGFPEQPEAYQVNDDVNPDGHVNLGWLAMTYELDGKRYTVEYFEDPRLPKPSRYSERPYGRFGAFFKTTLENDKPLHLRYRLHVSTGRAPERSAIQKRYDNFIAQ